MDRLVTHLQHNVPGLLRPSRVIKVRTIYGLIINTLLLYINKLKAVRHDATVECFSLVVKLSSAFLRLLMYLLRFKIQPVDTHILF